MNAEACPSTDEWRLLAAAVEHDPDTTARSALPEGPGVYLWRHAGRIVYVGKADSLRTRLSTHRGRGESMAGSSLRRNVAALLYGIEPKVTGKGRERATPEQAAAVASWIRSSTVAWVECDSSADAGELEKQLRSQWLPPLNRA